MTQQRDSESQSDARWLRESRRVAGFSNVHKLLSAVAGAGLKPPSYGSYAQWESGAVRPREESLASLRAFYADRIKAPVIAAPAEDPLIAALTAQTRAIDALVALLAGGDLLARVGALEPVVSRLVERVLGEPPMQRLPRETKG